MPENAKLNLEIHFCRAQTDLHKSAGLSLNDSDVYHRTNLFRQVVNGAQQDLNIPLEEDDTISEILRQATNSTS